MQRGRCFSRSAAAVCGTWSSSAPNGDPTAWTPRIPASRIASRAAARVVRGERVVGVVDHVVIPASSAATAVAKVPA